MHDLNLMFQTDVEIISLSTHSHWKNAYRYQIYSTYHINNVHTIKNMLIKIPWIAVTFQYLY